MQPQSSQGSPLPPSARRTVSVVTVTQYSRRRVLPLLVECLLRQTVAPTEWVVVEGSRAEPDARRNAELIANLKLPFKLVYVPYSPGVEGVAALGELRNRGHDACACEVVVCMDDDDYYPPRRIESVLRAFHTHPDVDLAGCTNMLVYDYPSKVLFQFRGVHARHSTQGALAFRLRYLQTHRHDETRKFAEESSFTKHFTEPMVQLPAFDTLVSSNHGDNTVDKSELVVRNPYFLALSDPVTDFMPEVMLRKYEAAFASEK